MPRRMCDDTKSVHSTSYVYRLFDGRKKIPHSPPPMRFTKNLFALISSLIFVTSVQIQAQAPVQPPANPPQDDAALREALRKALGDDAPAAPVRETPTTPVPPIAPVVPVTPIAPTALPVSPLTTYPYVVTN